MSRDEIQKLRLEVYALWYHSKGEDKLTYQKMLDLIDHACELKTSLKSVSALFSDLL